MSNNIYDKYTLSIIKFILYFIILNIKTLYNNIL